MAIVVGFASGAPSRAALLRGADEARLRNEKLIVVTPQWSLDEEDLAAQDTVTEVCAQLASVGVPYEVRTMSGTLDPAEEIIEIARAHSALFIVIGLRRRSPVGKALLGSTAQQVLLQAPCPVLAVKAESAEDDPRSWTR